MTTDRELQQTTILWGALFAGPLMLLAALFVVRKGMGPNLSDLHTVLLAVGFVVAVSAVVASRVVSDAMGKKLVAATPKPAAINVLRVQTLIGMALCEGAAMLCAVLWFLTGEDRLLIAFALPFAGMFRLRPTAARLADVQRLLDTTRS